MLFNTIFNNNYPLAWTYAKVFTIHKKGDPQNPGNYRGIGIMSAIAKVYDMVLNERFNLWYRPQIDQAGAQKGCGCEEQYSLLDLIDIARKTKKKLHIFH